MIQIYDAKDCDYPRTKAALIIVAFVLCNLGLYAIGGMGGVFIGMLLLHLLLIVNYLK